MFALEMNDKPLPTTAWVVGSFVGDSLGKNVAVIDNSTADKLVIFMTVVYFDNTLMQVRFVAGRAN
jgi:hypothetical protein